MKAEGTHEGCIEQIQRLYAERLYTNKPIALDEQGRIRIDDLEMNPNVQAQVAALWSTATTETLPEIGDLAGYRNDFHNLFGFGLTGVDYAADADEMVMVESIK